MLASTFTRNLPGDLPQTFFTVSQRISALPTLINGEEAHIPFKVFRRWELIVALMVRLERLETQDAEGYLSGDVLRPSPSSVVVVHLIEIFDSSWSPRISG